MISHAKNTAWHRAVLVLILVTGFAAAPSPLRGGDAAFEALFAARRWDDAAANARARLSANAEDLVAMHDVVRVIVESNRRAEFGEAEELLDVLVVREPHVARHHFLLGQVCGRLAPSAGLGAMGLARKSRRALARAVELAPRDFEYAYALNEFYLDAPGIVGGSVSKARQAAEAFTQINRDAGLLMQARVLGHEKKYSDALARIAEITGRDDALVNITRRVVLVQIGGALVDAGRPLEALKVFTQVTGEFPNNAPAHLGLGRARLQSGDAAGAIEALHRSAEIAGHGETFFQLGLAYQAHGDSEPARDAYRTALERGLGGKNADEARRRLAALGG